MKKDIKAILNYDIIENVGIGDIRFGMTMEEFSQYYNIQKGMKDNILRIPKELDGVTDYNAYYMFNDSVCFDFNKEKKLYSIVLDNNFQGKLNGKIGIGSCIGELRALRKDIFVYAGDEGLCLGTGFRFKIEIDNDQIEENVTPDYDNFAKGSLDEFKIISISMEAWHRSDTNHRENWCYYLDEWIEPEEKYLEIRYN